MNIPLICLVPIALVILLNGFFAGCLVGEYHGWYSCIKYLDRGKEE